MSLQTLIVFSPFLAVLYVLYGLIQALRRKEQGFIAAFIAFLTIAGTVAAYVISTDTFTKARLTQLMLLNAIIVFIGSILMLLLERRNPDRDKSRSYGMLGLGMSILLALGIFVTPILANALPNQSNATANNRTVNGTLENVRSFTPGAQNNVNQGNAASTEAAPDTTANGDSQLAQVLTAQTGLSTDDLTTQVSSGSTIAQLVSAHNGDLTAVTDALVKALDQLTAQGTQGAQFLSRLGSDNSAIASQIVQGSIPAQFLTRILPMLITGQAPSFGGNRTGGGNGNGGGFAPPNANSTAEVAPTVESTPQPAPGSNSASPQVAQVISAQTGLSAADLTTQLSGGSTIAQLVAAHNGDLNTVTTAIANALDQLVASGGRSAQLLSVMGSDTTAIATQIVQGQLPAQAQQRIVAVLLGETAGGTGNGSGAGGFAPPNNAQPTEVTPTATPLPPTATVIRPTQIVFPTATPTLETTEQATAAATSAAAACTLIPNYNLNLRDQPNKDTGSVLVSIPLGTNVSADQVTSDGWYHVSYAGHDGWVDGAYASPSAGCSSLPTATATGS